MYKIIFIIDNLLVSGTQVHLSRLVSSLEVRSFSPEIISFGAIDEALIKSISQDKIFRVKMDSIKNPIFWPGFFYLIFLLKKKKPTVVHTYLNTANVFGVLAARIAGVTVIVSSRRDMGHFRSQRIAALEQLTNRFVNRIVCVSEAVKSQISATREIDPSKVVVLYNGLDPMIFNNKSNKISNGEMLVVGMIATMDREIKGHQLFIDVADLVLRQKNKVRFIIIGDGRLRSSLEDYVRSKGLTRYFNFKGACYDVKRELEAMDIFIMPSLSEGLSNAILEAMSMGIPVVANAVGGNLELIEDNVNGFLVPLGNPRIMADKVLSILEGPYSKLSKIGYEGRMRVVEKFTIEHMADNYKAFYEDLLAARIK
ncbi:MAG: glycosyltransferase [bacterium]